MVIFVLRVSPSFFLKRPVQEQFILESLYTPQTYLLLYQELLSFDRIDG